MSGAALISFLFQLWDLGPQPNHNPYFSAFQPSFPLFLDKLERNPCVFWWSQPESLRMPEAHPVCQALGGDEGVQSVCDVVDHLRAPCWKLLNIQLRSHLGCVSRLLFSCQGLLSKLQLWSVAGPAWAPPERSIPDFTHKVQLVWVMVRAPPNTSLLSSHHLLQEGGSS